MKKLVAFLGFACAAVASYGQMPDLTPPAELKFFDFMKGSWTGTMKWSYGAEMEVPTTLKVESEGQFLKMTNEMDMAGMKMTEVQYVGWDAAKKQFVSYAFTNFSPQARIERGTATGNKQVMESEPWTVGPGETMLSRATLIKKSDTEFDLNLEFKIEGKWQTASTVTMKKKG